ncbi:7,8-dihydropterin-6-methyl-4-(beta-D-ribofuranosyl)-aminobenzene-5'-phosphate synthase [uncultured archaeon]|nr:7,8-dihydropterin-6-methyl-4-(beta-D-ribofuranosyl)-aminobenzene-5'-phosphate synthase [uncultured archaeon]
MELDLGSDRINILMDTGASQEVTLHNIDILNLDLDDVDLIFLSHGHYDHTGGLMGILMRMNRKVPVLAHPEIFAPKLKALPFLNFIGLPFNRAQVEDAGAVMLEPLEPVALAKNVSTTGEVQRIVPFEKLEGFWTIKDNQYRPDTISDDRALVVNIEGKGLVVITGCSHAGIINTIRHAQRVMGVEELYVVIGGFQRMKSAGLGAQAAVSAFLLIDDRYEYGAFFFLQSRHFWEKRLTLGTSTSQSTIATFLLGLKMQPGWWPPGSCQCRPSRWLWTT